MALEEYEPSATSAFPPVSPDTANSYLAQRLKPQLAWFDQRAQAAKRWNFTLVTAQLLMTSTIPIANAAGGSTIVSTTLAALVAVATGVLQVGKFHDNWTRYRYAARTLDEIKIRYELELSPFSGDRRHALMIQEAEKAISQEGQQWLTAMSLQKEGTTTKRNN